MKLKPVKQPIITQTEINKITQYLRRVNKNGYRPWVTVRQSHTYDQGHIIHSHKTDRPHHLLSRGERLYVEVHERRGQKAVLINLLEAIDSATGENYQYRFRNYNVNDLILAVRKAVIIHGVGLIIIDEAQNLAKASKSETIGNNERTSMKFIEELFNRIAVPLCFVGTFSMLKLFSKEMTIMRRATTNGSLLMVSCKLNSSFWQRFTSIICQTDLLQNQQTDQETLCLHIHRLTAGIPAVAVSLVKATLSYLTFLEPKNQDLSLKALNLIFEQQFKILKPAIYALRKGNYHKFEDFEPMLMLENASNQDELEALAAQVNEVEQQALQGTVQIKTETSTRDTSVDDLKLMDQMSPNELVANLGYSTENGGVPMRNLIELLPGEHLAGFIGRFHSLGINESLQATTDYLKLKSQTIRPHRFFHDDDAVLHHMFKERGIESTWFDHGFGHYIWPFLKTSEQSEVTHCLTHSNVEPLNFKLRGLYSTYSNHWRWCHECVEEDYQQYGTSYYHRDHQLPGTFHCERHRIGLSDCCSECGFTVSNVSQLPVPPVDNACPDCGAWLSSFEGYFSDSMRNIEQMTFRLANNNFNLHLDQFADVILNHIGIDRSDIGTLKGNNSFSAWTNGIGTDFDRRTLIIYFCNLEEIKTGITSPLFNHPRLYNSSSPRAPLHPLMHLIALNHAGFDANDLSTLVE